ncbi:MAG: uroporphyrinogen III synthase, partial [Erythrobacter sp.]|nr:uroporphyrinogen III synthase [Erythrobacter sp.]
VLDAITAPCHLLRIAGEEHVPLTPPAGVTFAEVIAYRSEALPLDPAAPLLASGEALVLLHSAATAAHFAAECDRLGLSRARITLAALGPRIAAAAGEGWAAIHIAATPDESTLLQLAFDLCQQARSIPSIPPRQP